MMLAEFGKTVDEVCTWTAFSIPCALVIAEFIRRIQEDIARDKRQEAEAERQEGYRKLRQWKAERDAAARRGTGSLVRRSTARLFVIPKGGP
jgi:hypothetical protein